MMSVAQMPPKPNGGGPQITLPTMQSFFLAKANYFLSFDSVLDFQLLKS
jgi:hypothetical protein